MAYTEDLLETPFIKKLLLSLLIGIAVLGCANSYSNKVHADIASSVVRLHVIANSDSEADQNLKLSVRDGVVDFLSDKLENAKSVSETKRIINENLPGIKKAAQNVISDKGCNYSVKCMTGVFDFPTKSYGTSKLPAGEYYALRVVIGSGEGKNWWCVLYPQLCFEKFGDASRQKLKNVLTDEEYNIVTNSDGSIKYKFKFKLLELLGK